MSYICPVCAYRELPRPPKSFLICPSCGTEFGYEDFSTSHDVLRARWIRSGAQWYSEFLPKPIRWNGLQQLLDAGLAIQFGNASTTATRGDSGLFALESPIAEVSYA